MSDSQAASKKELLERIAYLTGTIDRNKLIRCQFEDNVDWSECRRRVYLIVDIDLSDGREVICGKKG